ncbi:MAG: Fic family protein [Ahrensia sp.]|nr:Fic family protein [Ahrensia sp.]
MGAMLRPTYNLPTLPPDANLESVAILKALAKANRALGELKGKAVSIPNQSILINTLALQEAKASSEIENIVTTQDELFREDLLSEMTESPTAKEVARYRDTLRLGHEFLQAHGAIANRSIISMYRVLKSRQDGFRNAPGTTLRNDRTGEIIYVPPQTRADIEHHMNELEQFINEPDLCDLDPLIKMALIHHQFESIHPFADRNGRIGRIINVLYLCLNDLLDIPVLYLSRFINANKDKYYQLLQDVRDQGFWQAWVLFMLEAVEQTAIITLSIVEGMRAQMNSMKQRMRTQLPKLYSQDLLNNLFRHPYTRIEFVQNDLRITRQTAARYLDILTENGFVQKVSAGRSNYFINVPLVTLLSEAAGERVSGA